MIFIKNIIVKLLLLIIVPTFTVILYFVTFFTTKLQFLKIISYVVYIVRSVCFFICGVKLEIRGIENIPNIPCLIASKHQSMLETSFLFNTVKPNIVYAYKKEVGYIPFWGRITKKFDGVSVDRGGGKKGYESLLKGTQGVLARGKYLAIYPEGTRVAVGETVPLKKGIAKLYKDLKVPVVPVALNTGYVYPKGSFLVKPGKMIIEFLPPIYPGLEEKEFLEKLFHNINERSLEILKELNYK